VNLKESLTLRYPLTLNVDVSDEVLAALDEE
jgi:hypothetical protein